MKAEQSDYLKIAYTQKCQILQPIPAKFLQKLNTALLILLLPMANNLRYTFTTHLNCLEKVDSQPISPATAELRVTIQKFQ